MKTEILEIITQHKYDHISSEQAVSELLDLFAVSNSVKITLLEQSEQLKAFADYAQKRMWEDGDKDLSDFVDEFLRR